MERDKLYESLGSLPGVNVEGCASTTVSQRNRSGSISSTDLVSARLVSLIESLDGGIMVEGNDRKIVLVNKSFCELFHIPVKPDDMIGWDCEQAAQGAKALFVKEEAFLDGIHSLLRHKTKAVGERLELKDGRVFERDYVPIWVNEVYRGHMYHYRDVTEMVRLQQQVEEERQNYENILLSILPREVVSIMKKGVKFEAVTMRNVGIIFVDIVGFTSISLSVTPRMLVNFLDELFETYDNIFEKHEGAERVKTIGDCYMGAVGMFTQEGESDAPKNVRVSEAIIKIGTEILEVSKAKKLPAPLNSHFSVRVGAQIGEVVGGVVGKAKPYFDLWGDAVNTASRMESHAGPNKFHVTEQVHENYIEASTGEFTFLQRKGIHVKGKGNMNTFYVEKTEGWSECHDASD